MKLNDKIILLHAERCRIKKIKKPDDIQLLSSQKNIDEIKKTDLEIYEIRKLINSIIEKN